ncbi:MAG: hypothetical protein WCK42_02080 [Myxococcaceae bacterium]
MKNHVVHARIDQDTFGEIQSLKETLGLSKTTEVISLALHRLFAENKKINTQKSPFELMEEAGLIGCIDSKFIDSSRDSIKQNMLSAVEEKIKSRGNHV